MRRRNTRDAVLHAAERLFVDNRFDRVTLEGICREAHVGRGSVYRYFRDKEDLYASVLTAGMEQLRRAVEREVERASDPAEALEAAAGALLRFYRRRRNLLRWFQAEVCRGNPAYARAHAEVHRHRKELVERLAGIIRQQVGTGARRRRLAAPDAARLFLAMVREASRIRAEDGAAGLTARKVVSLFLHGIGGS